MIISLIVISGVIDYGKVLKDIPIGRPKCLADVNKFRFREYPKDPKSCKDAYKRIFLEEIKLYDYIKNGDNFLIYTLKNKSGDTIFVNNVINIKDRNRDSLLKVIPRSSIYQNDKFSSELIEYEFDINYRNQGILPLSKKQWLSPVFLMRLQDVGMKIYNYDVPEYVSTHQFMDNRKEIIDKLRETLPSSRFDKLKRKGFSEEAIKENLMYMKRDQMELMEDLYELTTINDELKNRGFKSILDYYSNIEKNSL